MGLLDSTSGTRNSADGLGLRPIIAHGFFPTGLALWMGALFALSVLAVRGAVLEQAVLDYDLDSVLPMLSPPVGGMTRLILAGMLGVLGAGLGYGLARVLQLAGRPAKPVKAAAPIIAPAAAKSAPAVTSAPSSGGLKGAALAMLASLRKPLVSRDAHPDAPTRAPIRAHEELGLSLGPVPMAPTPAYQHESLPDEQPLVLDHVYEAEVEPEPEPEPEPVAPEPVAITPPTEPAQPRPRLAPAPLAPPIDGPSAADRIASAPAKELTNIELVSRLAGLMERHHLNSDLPDAAPPAAAPAPQSMGADAKSALLGDALASLRALG